MHFWPFRPLPRFRGPKTRRSQRGAQSTYPKVSLKILRTFWPPNFRPGPVTPPSLADRTALTRRIVRGWETLTPSNYSTLYFSNCLYLPPFGDLFMVRPCWPTGQAKVVPARHFIIYPVVQFDFRILVISALNDYPHSHHFSAEGLLFGTPGHSRRLEKRCRPEVRS